MEILQSVVEKNISSPDLNVNRLSSEMGMSRPVLYAKIKVLTGYSIQDFIRIIRLRKAAHVLTESDMPVSEVAFTLGFANAKHFSTAFRKHFGKSPSAFRVPSA